MEPTKKRKPATCSSCGKKGHRRDSKRCPNYNMNKFLDRHRGPWDKMDRGYLREGV